MLEKYGVEMIGANADVIAKAESREQFKQAMEKIGLDVCRGETVHDDRRGPRACSTRSACRASCGPASRWAARGSAIAYNRDEFDELVLPRARPVAGHARC